jgi:alpha-L-fucosidase
VGGWYYAPGFTYSAAAVIRFLLECVSRDGCYAVNIPILPDGSLEPECERMLKEIGNWMKTNGDGIYGSKAWKKLGEGKDGKLRLLPHGFVGKEMADFTFGPEDFRFTEGKDGNVYAYCLSVPEQKTELTIVSLGRNAGLLDKKISSVELLGYKGKIAWKQEDDALHITCPGVSGKLKTALCFRIKTTINDVAKR